jgi:hypothetical protein
MVILNYESRKRKPESGKTERATGTHNVCEQRGNERRNQIMNSK